MPIDHSFTKVLLIGASEFPNDLNIAPIPNVEVNISKLYSALSNSLTVGIPKDNILLSLNESRSDVERKLKSVLHNANNKKFTIIVYYSGHGIQSSEDFSLYLSTKLTTSHDLEIEGFNIDQFKKYIKKSIAGRKMSFRLLSQWRNHWHGRRDG